MRIQPQDQGALLAAQALAAADPAPRLQAPQGDPEAARSAAQRLEGLFATLLVKEMRTTQASGIFGEGTSADVYGGWFDQFLGEVLAKRGELQLTRSIEHSLAAKEAEAP
jgi:Rod binding domain-containing protein